jgi:hypothetical protein
MTDLTVLRPVFLGEDDLALRVDLDGEAAAEFLCNAPSQTSSESVD